jgi:thiol:disulfide interchange protein DsbD
VKALNFLFPAMLATLSACAPHGGPVKTENAEAELVAARDAVEPGKPLLVALRLKARPGWHTYWRNPGDSGQPTSVEWKLPPGFAAGPIRWPVPQRFQTGPLANYGYEGEVLLAAEIGVPADAKGRVRLAAKARWLVCDPKHCIPESGEVSLAFPAGTGGPGKWAAALEAVRLPQPPPAAWKMSARREGERVILEVLGCEEPWLYFFPYAEGKIEHGAPQGLECGPNGVRLAIPVSRQPVGEFTRLAGILAAKGGRGYEIDVPIAAAK